MYATATDGNLPNNKQFSSCSRDIMGRTIANNGDCFVEGIKRGIYVNSFISLSYNSHLLPPSLSPFSLILQSHSFKCVVMV